MPENDKERLLGGEVTLTPSSDEAITQTIKGLRSEIHAIGSTVDADYLAPKSLTSSITEEISTDVSGEEKDIKSRNHTYSSTALAILEDLKLKRAA